MATLHKKQTTFDSPNYFLSFLEKTQRKISKTADESELLSIEPDRIYMDKLLQIMVSFEDKKKDSTLDLAKMLIKSKSPKGDFV